MRSHEAAGGVVLNPHGKIALVEQHGNSWCLPKGGVEEGESLLDAARREIAEETGVTELQYIGELGSYERKSIALGGVGETESWGSRRRTFFLFKTPQEALEPKNDPHQEITQARWVTFDEALELLTHPKDKEFLAGARGAVEAALQ